MLETWTQPLPAAECNAAAKASALGKSVLRLAAIVMVLLSGSTTVMADDAVGRYDRSQLAQMATGGPQLPSEQDFAVSRLWQAVTVEGQVHVLTDDGQSIAWTPVRPGQELQGNSLIETGPDSSLLLFNGRDAITVGAETRLGLLATDANADVVEIFQASGNADYQVEHRSPGLSLEGFLTGVSHIFGAAPEGRFEVHAPYVTTLVKGTVFTVTVEHDNTEVSVSDGVVEVRDRRSGNRTDIRAGQSATARSNPAAGIRVDVDVDVLLDPGAKAPPSSDSNNDSSSYGGEKRDSNDRAGIGSIASSASAGSGSTTSTASAGTGSTTSTASGGSGSTTSGASGGSGSSGSGGSGGGHHGHQYGHQYGHGHHYGHDGHQGH